jgi:c-di-AMP phosphodiesterase-like protein
MRILIVILIILIIWLMLNFYFYHQYDLSNKLAQLHSDVGYCHVVMFFKKDNNKYCYNGITYDNKETASFKNHLDKFITNNPQVIMKFNENELIELNHHALKTINETFI